MTADDAALLAALPHWAFGFVLVLGRVGGAMMLLPGIGEADLPVRIRAGMALALTLLLISVVLPDGPPQPDGVWQDVAALAAEIAVGLWLSWLARLLMFALEMAADFLSVMIGLTSILLPNPGAGAASSEMSRILGLAATVLVLASGLYAQPLTALAGSYALLPLGGHGLSGADLAQTALRGLGQSFSLALRLAAPFVFAGTVWQLALAVLSRLVPRLQVYFLALPAQVLGGLALIAALSTALLAAWQTAAQAGFASLPGGL